MGQNHRSFGGGVVAVAGLALVVFSSSRADAADPFRVLAYEAGGGLDGVAGLGLTTSTGGFYNRFGSTNVDLDSSDPTVWTESSINHIAYDSYFALNGGGPSRSVASETGETLTPQIRSFYANVGVTYADDYFDASGNGTQLWSPGAHLGATGDDDGQAPFPAGAPVDQARTGFAVSPPPVPSGASPLGQGVFIAQFTLNAGSVVSGGMLFTTRVSFGVGSTHAMVLNGPAVVFETAPGVFQPLVLRSYLVATNDDLSHSRSGGNLGTGSGSSQRFGAAEVHHLWVEVIPTPGAGVVLAMAGVAGLGRRRRD